jgi:phosphatidylglycerol:prolipoprotein diacylglycerol transferase
MFPILFRIGEGCDVPGGSCFEITSFGLMMFLSFIVGAWLLGKQLARYGVPKEYAWDLLAWIAIGGIVGAKLWYLGLNYQDLLAAPVRELTSRGGLVWYGGLAGGVLAYYLQVRARKLPMAVMFDGTAPALAAAYGVGRMGCFLVGDDYGRYTTSWIGIAFPEGSPPTTAAQLRELGSNVPASIPGNAIVEVIPTQLFEVALGFLMFVILWNIGKRQLRTGQLFSLFLVLYSIERFFIEFVRAKGDRVIVGLSTSQIVSIVLLGIGTYLWLHRGRVGETAPTPANPPALPPAPAPKSAPRNRAGRH